MTITLSGTYRNGKIELDERPPDALEGRKVLVTIQSPADECPTGPYIYRGMFAKPGVRDATWEDFQEAKKTWEVKGE